MDLIDFITKSNNIEGEKTLPEKELPVYEWWIANECSEENLKALHKGLWKCREPYLRGFHRL